MEWAKLRSSARFNLATSGLTNVLRTEFPLRLDDLEITGGGYGYAPLLERIARHTGAPVECIVTADGTSLANHLAMAALLNPGDEVLIEQPGYGPLLDVAHYLGAEVQRIERRFENEFAISLGEMEAALTPATRLVVLTNLHNPSGALLPAETLRAVGELAERVGARVLVDEVYLEMLPGERNWTSGSSSLRGGRVGSLSHLVESRPGPFAHSATPARTSRPSSRCEGSAETPPNDGLTTRPPRRDELPLVQDLGSFSLGKNFVVTSSLTKAYGLSGLRCGWILAAPEVAQRIRLLHDLFAATRAHPAERMSVVAFDRLDLFRDRTRQLLATNRPLLDAFLDSRSDLECVRPPAGTVVFPRLRRGDPAAFFKLLREKYETSVVPGEFFEAPRHFRLGIGGETENLRGGLERLGAALDEFA